MRFEELVTRALMDSTQHRRALRRSDRISEPTAPTAPTWAVAQVDLGAAIASTANANDGAGSHSDEDNDRQVVDTAVANDAVAGEFGSEDPDEEARTAVDNAGQALIALDSEERNFMIEQFDLNDSDLGTTPQVDPERMTLMVLQEVPEREVSGIVYTEMERGYRNWQHVVQHYANESLPDRRPMSPTERMWNMFAEYNDPNAWGRCQQAADLGGTLLLHWWETTDDFTYRRARQASGVNPWLFPGRMLGGMYCKSEKMQATVGKRLKPLYLKHRLLVEAGLNYVQAARRQLREYGVHQHNREQEDIVDSLVLSHFPWVETRHLGTQELLPSWDTFRDDVFVYSRAIEILWREKEVVAEEDGTMRMVSDSECDWDSITAKLSKYRSRQMLKTVLNKCQNLQKNYHNSAAKRTRARLPQHQPLPTMVQDDGETKEEDRDNDNAAADDNNTTDDDSGTVHDEESMSHLMLCGDRTDHGEEGDSDSEDDGEPVPSLLERNDGVETDSDESSDDDDVPDLLERNDGSETDSDESSDDDDSDGETSTTAHKQLSRHRATIANNPPAKRRSRHQQQKRRHKRQHKKEPPYKATRRKPATKKRNAPQMPQNSYGATPPPRKMTRKKKLPQETATPIDCTIVDEVEDPSVLSVVSPKPGCKFQKMEQYNHLPDLLQSAECRAQVDQVTMMHKSESGMLYSVDQLKTAPHVVHSVESSLGVQRAAVGLPHAVHNGTSIFSSKFSVVYPKTPEYKQMHLDDIFANIDLGALVGGVYNFGTTVPLTQDKAKELAGESRKSINFGIGIGGHNYEHGRNAQEGEFAEAGLMNADSLDYFPENGKSLGDLFEALGRASETLTQRLQVNKRTDQQRNEHYAGRVGKLLGKPDCLAGESLFISIVGHNSKYVGHVIDRLNKKISETTTGDSVGIHTDPQNPHPSSPYSRVVMVTWRVRLHGDNEGSWADVTGILCNRALVCNRESSIAARIAFDGLYTEAVANHMSKHGGARYEDDGLALFPHSKPLLMSYLKDESWPRQKTTPAHAPQNGGWTGHVGTPTGDGTNSYALVQSKKGDRSLQTVGDQSFTDPTKKGTSDVHDIEQHEEPILHSRMHTIDASPNKMMMMSAVRAAAKRVADKFELKHGHIWDLFFCQLQHISCWAIFIAKCLSLVDQWSDKWENTEWGTAWLKACCGNGLDGTLASQFMNMTDPQTIDRVAGDLRRVRGNHLYVSHGYTAPFCHEQVEYLRLFAECAEQMSPTKCIVSFLTEHGKQGSSSLGDVINLGKFGLPQVLTNLYLWGLANIPAWRASECPILDTKKHHYRKAKSNLDEAEASGQSEFHRIATEEYDLKSLRSMHRMLCIIAHLHKVGVFTVENGCCETNRKLKALDYIVEHMDMFDLRPAADNNPYDLSYELWMKRWGPDEAWHVVDSADVETILNMAARTS